MNARFPSTRWSLLAGLRGGDPELAREALAVICRVYWPPVYAAVRRSGFGRDDAYDLTQEFFVHLLERDSLPRADAARGRFRTFLLGCLRNFLSHERERRSARRRAPERRPVSIDGGEAEERYRLEPADELTPDQVFQRQWSYTVMARALERLRADQRDRAAIPDRHLVDILLGAGEGPSYREIAEGTGSTEAAVKAAAHRLRKRFGSCLRAEIGPTVDDERLVDDELRFVVTRFGESGMSLPAGGSCGPGNLSQ